MMCKLNFLTLQYVVVKYFISSIFRVWHFSDGPLRSLHTEDLSLRRQRNTFYTKRGNACFEETSLVARFLHHYKRQEPSFVY